MIQRLIFFLLFVSRSSLAEEGPVLNDKQINPIVDLNKINLYKDVYIKSFSDIDPKWMEKFALPFSMELGNFFSFNHLPINFNLLGFYKLPLIFQGGDYVFRAQISFPLLD